MLSDLVLISNKGNSCHNTDTVQGSTKYASTLASLTCYSVMPATSIMNQSYHVHLPAYYLAFLQPLV